MGQRGRHGISSGLLVLADAAAVVAAYVLAFALRFHGLHVFPGHHLSNLRALTRALPLFVVVSLVLAQVYGLYDHHPMTWPEQVQSLFVLVVLDAVLAMATAFFVRSFAVPRSVVALAAVLDFLILYAYRRAVYLAWMARHGPPSLLFIHAGGVAAASLPEPESGAFRLIGTLHLGAETQAPSLLVLEAVRESRADGIMLDAGLTGVLKEQLALLALEHGLELFIVPRLLDLLVQQSRPALFGDRLVINLAAATGLGYQRALKRFVDISLSLFFLILTAPLLALAALIVVLDDGFPILYRQERLGRHGRPFQVVKLRTMRRDAEALSGPVLAARNDPRVTRSGRWLRHLHVDELPQLWTVLKGEMSLVGPRPERPMIHAEVSATLPQFAARLRMLPGLTGLAQVHGAYDIQPNEKLKFDVMYSLRSSAAMDVQILLRTARNVISGISKAASRRSS